MIARRRRFGLRIDEVRRLTGLPHESILRDHALSYMLAGLAAVPELAERVAFKGGTSLRKCYFEDYRLSDDRLRPRGAPLRERQRADLEMESRRTHTGFPAEEDAGGADPEPGKDNPEDIRVVLVVGV